jgi:PKD repeat protein
VTINGPYTGKPTLPISFTSTVSELYDSTFTYMWSFGDGSTSNVADPTHTYAVIGTYNVSLTVTGQYAESTTVTSTASIIAQGTGPTLKGTVKSGSAAVVGAHVYLLAANTTGYGQMLGVGVGARVKLPVSSLGVKRKEALDNGDSHNL